MPRVSESDSKLIEQLHNMVFHDSTTQEILASAFQEALAIFKDPEYSLPFASYNIPVTHFTQALNAPEQSMIGLCRVFILRAGCKMPRPEIHRNSIQRLVSFKGEGSISSASPGGVDMTFKACAIVSPELDSAEDLMNCWDVVPENTWHFPQADAGQDWFTVTFHSATEDTIVDEYWEPQD
ncbi:hypothetical protein ACUM5Y_04785 [Marinomonas dokdonensis]|uniref:hypothetical protein n=1 Tax=Marinomonas dokdonensis TaxID=328224 RepID=UPI0040554681